MSRIKLLTCAIVLILVFLSASRALAATSTPPELSVLFYGALQVNNESATAGTSVVIRLKTNNTEIASVASQTVGQYFIEVPCHQYVGEKIFIKVDNLIARESECVEVMTVPSVMADVNLNMADVAIDSKSDRINIPATISDSTEVKISFTATTTTSNGQIAATVGNSGLTINRNSAKVENNFTVVFAPNTVITGPSNWNGAMNAPIISNLLISVPTEEGKTNQIKEVINIGFTGHSLSFDQPVSILFPQMADKLLGFSHNGSDFTEIINNCPADNGDSLISGINECKFNRGADLVVWTRHFTNFVVFSRVAIPVVGGSAAPVIPIPEPIEILGVKIAVPEIFNSATSSIALEQISASAYKRDLAKERAVLAKYLGGLIGGQKNIAEKQTWDLINFITYGASITAKLGMGERAGVLNSYKIVFGKLPQTESDWADIIKIANGSWPVERNLKNEIEALAVFKKIYWRQAEINKPEDKSAIMLMSYGLRPAKRNLDSERAAIKTFNTIFKYNPKLTKDWDIIRAIAYSGSKR